MTLNKLAHISGVPYNELLALIRRGAIRARYSHNHYIIDDALVRRVLPLLRTRRLLQESHAKLSRHILVTISGVAARASTSNSFISYLVRRGALKLTQIGNREGVEINYLNRVLPVLRSLVSLHPSLALERRREILRSRLANSKKNVHRKVTRSAPGNRVPIRPAA